MVIHDHKQILARLPIFHRSSGVNPLASLENPLPKNGRLLRQSPHIRSCQTSEPVRAGDGEGDAPCVFRRADGVFTSIFGMCFPWMCRSVSILEIYPWKTNPRKMKKFPGNPWIVFPWNMMEKNNENIGICSRELHEIAPRIRWDGDLSPCHGIVHSHVLGMMLIYITLLHELYLGCECVRLFPDM